MGRPLLETQKVDPKDVGSFWKKHDPPLGRSKDFWMTEEGRSLMTEWDNGTPPIPIVRPIPNVQQSEAFPLKRLQQEILYQRSNVAESTLLVQGHLPWRRAFAQHRHTQETQGCR